MTDKKLLELLVVIDNHYGRIRSKDERRADTQIYIRAFGTCLLYTSPSPRD